MLEILKDHGEQNKLVNYIDNFFIKLKQRYQEILQQVLKSRFLIIIFAIMVLVLLPFLYSHTAKETAPEEDQGFFFRSGDGSVLCYN